MRDRMRFRAWDKENKKYIYGVEKGLKLGNLQIMTLAEIEESDKYELEQCSGLKDKNEKLIYEGDMFYFNHTYWNVFFDEIEALWCIDNNKNNSKAFCGIDNLDIRVSANIHENPEQMCQKMNKISNNMRDRMRFRAWDKENRKYVYDVEKGLKLGNSQIMTLAEIEESDKYELEQCSGLKDKSKKLIYEGDMFCINHTYWSVFFDEIATVWSLDNNKGNLQALCDIDTPDIHVSANIHENSELLEA